MVRNAVTFGTLENTYGLPIAINTEGVGPSASFCRNAGKSPLSAPPVRNTAIETVEQVVTSPTSPNNPASGINGSTNITRAPVERRRNSAAIR